MHPVHRKCGARIPATALPPLQILQLPVHPRGAVGAVVIVAGVAKAEVVPPVSAAAVVVAKVTGAALARELLQSVEGAPRRAAVQADDAGGELGAMVGTGTAAGRLAPRALQPTAAQHLVKALEEAVQGGAPVAPPRLRQDYPVQRGFRPA